MRKNYFKWPAILLFLTLFGCTVEKPEDASDAKASDAWIKSSLKKASKTPNADARIHALIGAYTDALQLQVLEAGAHTTQLNAIPAQVYALSMQAGNLDTFKWAIDQGATVDTSYFELLKFWKLGTDWSSYIVGEYPEVALPIFMSQAADTYNVKFFDEHIAAFKATGFKVKSPLEATEFNVRFCHFIAEEIDEALQDKNRERIEFLIDHMPDFPSVVFIDRKTKESMQTLGDYIFDELNDEALACKLVALGYDYNRVDLDQTGFSDAFTDILRKNPDYAIRFLKLEKWEGALSESVADFLFTLPNNALGKMHTLYIDETIQAAMKTGNSESAMRFIRLRAEQNPFNQGAYTELLNWALEYGDETVFDYVMENCEEMNLFSIDLALLAKNQKLFMQYAPQIMSKIYYSMDTHPRSDGTTLGQIDKVFACENEKAGLFIVHKYNLSRSWEKATKGRTLLMDVCHAGNLEAARYLIERRGADLHTETGYSELEISMFGRTRPTEGRLSPIFFAAKSGNSKLLQYLASKGADVNARSNFGTTPLMHAVSAGHLEASKTLIALGAFVNTEMDPRFNNTDLREVGSFDEISTAYRRAQTSGNTALLEVLKKAGARP
jgi:hypothetical protein